MTSSLVHRSVQAQPITALGRRSHTSSGRRQSTCTGGFTSLVRVLAVGARRTVCRLSNVQGESRTALLGVSPWPRSSCRGGTRPFSAILCLNGQQVKSLGSCCSQSDPSFYGGLRWSHLNIIPTLYAGYTISVHRMVMENRPVDPGSIQGSHRPTSFMRIKYGTRANDLP